MSRILGIDPGLNGAAALYVVGQITTNANAVGWFLFDLPTIGDGPQRRINAPAFRDWLMQNKPDHAYIESVAAFPGQGVSSMFRFGRAVGAVEAVVAACDIPIDYVIPQVWKRFYGLRKVDKEASRALALRRFPTLSPHLARKLDHQRAEAALIAYFGAAAIGAVRSMSPLDSHFTTGG